MIADGEDFAETLAAAVGIPVGFAERATSRFHGFRRGAERIFIGSEFDRMDLEILLDFFNGLAGNIGGEALDIVGDQFFESVGHEFILCPGLKFVKCGSSQETTGPGGGAEGEIGLALPMIPGTDGFELGQFGFRQGAEFARADVEPERA